MDHEHGPDREVRRHNSAELTLLALASHLFDKGLARSRCANDQTGAGVQRRSCHPGRPIGVRKIDDYLRLNFGEECIRVRAHGNLVGAVGQRERIFGRELLDYAYGLQTWLATERGENLAAHEAA